MQSEEYKKWANGESEEYTEEETPEYMVEEIEDKEDLVAAEAMNIALN